MEEVFEFIQHQLPWLIHYKYLFLYIGGSIEGFNVHVLGGFLLSIKAINLIPAFLVLVLGEITNGYLWYTVGYFAGSKPLDKWIRKDERGKKVLEQVEKYFHKYSGRALILTRITLSLTVATLIMAGSLKYSLKKFFFYNIIGAVGWVILTMGVGFFFGQSYKFLFDYLASMTLAVLAIIGAIVLIYLARWFFKSAFVKSLMLNEKLKELGDKVKEGIDKMISSGNGK